MGSTIAVATFTGLLVFYNRSLLLATKTAADAAAKSAELAHQTLRLSQEALVMCHTADFQPRARDGVIGPQHSIDLLFKNMGPGVANDFKARAQLVVASCMATPVQTVLGSIIASGHTKVMNMGPLSPEQLADWQAQQRVRIDVAIAYSCADAVVRRDFLVLYHHDIKKFSTLEVVPNGNPFEPASSTPLAPPPG